MFTNKHVIIAMIVAPILAILAWIAVGQFAGEQPHKAVPGQSYPLLAQSNCRYPSGACDLNNEDLRLRLTLDSPQLELVLSASHALDGVLLAVSAPGTDIAPDQMRAVDGQGLEWRLRLAAPPAAGDSIRLIASAAGSSYFAEATTTFLEEDRD